MKDMRNRDEGDKGAILNACSQEEEERIRQEEEEERLRLEEEEKKKKKPKRELKWPYAKKKEEIKKVAKMRIRFKHFCKWAEFEQVNWS